jgi:hypothetical protein
MEPFNTLLQIPQLPFWLVRQVLKLFGIPPEPLVSFSAPYDYAAEPHVVFPHVSVVLHRQRWLWRDPTYRKLRDASQGLAS